MVKQKSSFIGKGVLSIPKNQLNYLSAPEMIRLISVHRKQRIAEKALNRSGIDFRSDDPVVVKRAYSQMTEAQFEAINGRQQFSNWIIIGHSLNGLVENRPLNVLDVGVGTGTSTKVLANFLPVGSEIIGYDLSPSLVEVARKQRYTHRTGREVPTRFIAQSVTDRFQVSDGVPMPDDSIDYINSSGIIGHHLDAKQLRQFAKEARRVLKRGGFLALDEGPAFKAREMSKMMGQFGFREVKHVRVARGIAVGQLIFKKMDS